MNCAMICALKTDFKKYLFLYYQNRMDRLILFFGFISFIFFSQHAVAQKDIPELEGVRIHDEGYKSKKQYQAVHAILVVMEKIFFKKRHNRHT